VEIVENGRAAVDAVKTAHAAKQPFDLIFMDMQMPELDGYSATRLLRQNGLNLPIVALTANAMAEDRVKCIEAGCTDYLPKPLTRAQLLRMAARFVKPGTRPMGASEPQPAPSAANSKPVKAGSLRSEMINEPRLAKLLERFVERLPERVATIESLLQEKDMSALRQAVHQLKGAGGGYGFPQITEIAAKAEEQIKSQGDLETIRQQVHSLVALVRSVEGYDPAREKRPQPTNP